MHQIIVAIDGYSSCGKSSTAKGVASRLGYTYIDSGAMYRAVTLYFHQNNISLSNKEQINKALDQISIEFKRDEKGENQIFLNGQNIEKEIRKLYVANKVSEVSAVAEVRHSLVALQQKMGKKRGIVMDGRDISSVVFPDAELKIFMTADPLIRAKRRQAELKEKGDNLSLQEVLANLKKRDNIDTSRKESPLIQVPDAKVIDTSNLTLNDQIELVCQMAESVLSEKPQEHGS